MAIKEGSGDTRLRSSPRRGPALVQMTITFPTQTHRLFKVLTSSLESSQDHLPIPTCPTPAESLPVHLATAPAVQALMDGT
jgi:hypothetical protein